MEIKGGVWKERTSWKWICGYGRHRGTMPTFSGGLMPQSEAAFSLKNKAVNTKTLKVNSKQITNKF